MKTCNRCKEIQRKKKELEEQRKLEAKGTGDDQNNNVSMVRPLKNHRTIYPCPSETCDKIFSREIFKNHHIQDEHPGLPADEYTFTGSPRTSPEKPESKKAKTNK